MPETTSTVLSLFFVKHIYLTVKLPKMFHEEDPIIEDAANSLRDQFIMEVS